MIARAGSQGRRLRPGEADYSEDKEVSLLVSKVCLEWKHGLGESSGGVVSNSKSKQRDRRNESAENRIGGGEE